MAAARRQVCARALDELKKEGQLDAEGLPIEVPLVAPPQDISWPYPCPVNMPLQFLEITSLQGEAEWPSAMVLTQISLKPKQPGWVSFGVLSAPASPAERPGFALQFDLGEGQPVARMEPTVMPWPPSAGATAHIRAYYHAILPDGPDTIAVVPLIKDAPPGSNPQDKIDWDRICGVSSKGKEEAVPLWLLPLCQRIASLHSLEQLGRLSAPIGPVPNPLRMEAVLGGGFGWGARTAQRRPHGAAGRCARGHGARFLTRLKCK